MADDYWVSFWKARGQESVGQDPQIRVCRTSNKQPISEDRWKQTLAYIHQQFPIGPGAVLLDACAGNGLFSREFADRGALVISLDISTELLAELDTLAHPRIQICCQDMRTLEFATGQFSHVFLYAGIQYISHAEAVRFVRACHHWLKPGGRLMIGDIPDVALRWAFYNSAERRASYFENLSQERDVIGTWFERDWVRFLAEDVGFSTVVIRDQPAEQIYAHFRFDAFFEK